MENHGSDDELFGLYETCLFSEDDSSRLTNDDQSSYDEVHLHRLKNSLSGVPPPPLVTYPQQNVDEILNALRSVVSSMEDMPDSPSDDLLLILRLFSQEKVEKILTFVKILNKAKEGDGEGCDEQNNCDYQNDDEVLCETSEKPSDDCQPNEAVNLSETENRCKFYDVGYNVNDLSEKIAELYDKYRERYVGCETSSFVTANSPTKYFGKKKEKFKLVGRSPARRAAFQKTRRKIFSSSSLLAAGKSGIFGHEKRTILMDRHPKKKDNKQTRRALFASPEDSKMTRSDVVKQSPSRLKAIEMRRSLWMRRKLCKRTTPSKQTPKKCGTPNKRTPRKGCSSGKGTPRKGGTPGKCTPRKSGGTPRRFLSPRTSSARKSVDSLQLSGCSFEEGDSQNEFNENGKRRRAEDVAALSQSNSSAGQDDLKLDNTLELSDTQRRKLLWAVSAALKQAGIGSTHKNFRLCGKKLYRICKNFWTGCALNRNVKVGISEKMLSLASEHVNNVIREVDDQNCSANSFDLWSQDSNSSDFFRQNDSRSET